MKLILFLCCLANFVCTSRADENKGSCNCMPLTKCKPLKTVLQAGTREARKTVLEKICKIDGFSIQVCCSNDTNSHEMFPRNCGRPKDQILYAGRIYGGTMAPMGQYPWIAALFTEDEGKPQVYCAGSVINARYIVTAAHCVYGHNVPLLSHVRLGEWNVSAEFDCWENKDPPEGTKKMMCSPKVMEYGIEDVIIHHNYNVSTLYSSDIALIRLNESIDFDASKGYIKPICFPHSGWNAEFHSGFKEAIAIGWGMTERRMSSDVLLEVKLPFIGRSQCQDHYEHIIEDTQICAGGELNSDTCRGDSGGPLMLADNNGIYVLAGIVSYGRTCGSEYPAIYTGASGYTDWVKYSMKEW